MVSVVGVNAGIEQKRGLSYPGNSMMPFNYDGLGHAKLSISFMQLRMMQINPLFMEQSHVPKRGKSNAIYVKKMSKIIV